MNTLDDLMEVWRSQDAVPLHGVNETLLRLALRQDQRKLEAERRKERRIVGVMSAFLVGVMALFLLAMIYNKYPKTGWDYAVPVVGAVVTLLWGGALFVSHRAQTVREQRFGESLRDQLNKHIAQLDYQATRAVRLASVLVVWLPAFVIAAVIIVATWRINNEPFRIEGRLAGWVAICLCALVAVWEARRSVQRDLLPRKRRLEALLKELDGQ